MNTDDDAGAAVAPLRPLLLPDDRGGQLHAVLHAPSRGRPSALVVHAHAFGPEMNLSRRQVALASRRLAEAGAAVLRVDLHGCGDSSGTAEAADWDRWDQDLKRAAGWLRALAPSAPLWWWGLRAGALVAAGACAGEAEAPRLLLWQPFADGVGLRLHWQRQAMAAALAQGCDAPSAGKALAAAWTVGETVELAGTPVSAAFAAATLGRALDLPVRATPPGRMVWIDVAPRPRPDPVPAVAARMTAWRAAGWQVEWQAVAGPAFWQGPEIQVAPALTEATARAVMGAVAAA